MKTLDQARTLSEQDRLLMQRGREAVRRHIPGAAVFLYGSVARGTQERDSDYDLLILTDVPVPDDVQERVCDAFYDIELANAVCFSAIFHTRGEWDGSPLAGSPFRRNVLHDAILL